MATFVLVVPSSDGVGMAAGSATATGVGDVGGALMERTMAMFTGSPDLWMVDLAAQGEREASVGLAYVSEV